MCIAFEVVYFTKSSSQVKVRDTVLKTFDEDIVTVNPYLGTDGVKPFIDVCNEYDKGIFVLVKTSNKSSGEFQDKIITETGEKTDSVEIVRKGNGTEAKRLEKYLYLDDNGSVFIYDGNVPAPSLIMIERNIYDSKGRLTVHTDNREVDFNTFYYDNGEVFMTSDVNSDGSREWVIYDSYKFDDHGNWIYRIAYRTMPFTTTPEGKVSGGNLAASSVTTRTITYR